MNTIEVSARDIIEIDMEQLDLPLPNFNVQVGAISNNIIEAKKKGRLGNSAVRVFAWMVAQIQDEDEYFNSYRIKPNHLSKVLGVDRRALKREFRKVAEQLSTHSVYLENEEMQAWYNIAPGIEIDKVKDEFIFTFNDKLKPFFLKLKERGGFSKYELDKVFSFDNVHGFYMYLFLKKHLHQGQESFSFEYDIEKFKGALNIIGKYTQYSNLRLKVLEPLQQEFNDKSDIAFTFNASKTGKAFTTLHFTVYRNKGVKRIESSYEATETDSKLELLKEYHILLETFFGSLSKDELETFCDELRAESGLIKMHIVEKGAETNYRNLVTAVGFCPETLKKYKLPLENEYCKIITKS